jgi:GT2 family glycosyltransferase
MARARVTAVVVTYQSEAVIRGALQTLRRSHDRGLLDGVVVDNRSTDDTLGVVRREHPWVRVIEAGGNLGYGRGCNLGILASTTPYVMPMNADASIEPDAVERLLAFLEARPDAALAAPALTGGAEPQLAGGLSSPSRILVQATGRRIASQRELVPGAPPVEVDWLCGALLVMRASAVRAAGGFDPRFFLYFEETDLCRRLRRRGHTLWAVGQAVAHHAGAASANQAKAPMFAGCIGEHYFRSRYHYLCKHWGVGVASLTELAEVALVGSRWLLRRARGRDASHLVPNLRRPVMRLPRAPQERAP